MGAVSTIGGRRFNLKTDFYLSGMQRCLLTSTVSIFLVSRLLTGRLSSFPCRHGDPIMKGVACWLRLGPWFSFTLRLCHFVGNIVVLFFVSPSQSIVFLLYFRFSRLPLSAVRLSTSMCLRVPQLLLNRYFASLNNGSACLSG